MPITTTILSSKQEHNPSHSRVTTMAEEITLEVVEEVAPSEAWEQTPTLQTPLPEHHSPSPAHSQLIVLAEEEEEVALEVLAEA